MTVPVEQITRERLEEWGNGCIRDHATPMLLLAIGHDTVSGAAHLYVPDDPSIDNCQILQLLYLALRELKL